jgi:hypothetical protein
MDFSALSWPYPYVDSSGTTHPLAEAWNGTRWSIQSIVNAPSGAGLSRVSCSAASACTAVSGGTLVERWNGSAWSSQTVAIPTGATSTQFDGVACTGASRCVAVGQWREFHQTPPGCNPLRPPCKIIRLGGTVTELWNGSSWAIQSTPSQAAGYSSGGLFGVSCASATACMAVGGNVAEQWNGSIWSATPGAGVLAQVSCTAAANCTAVGGGPLVEGWNGSSWATQPPAPIPPGPASDQFSGVSCPTATDCTAVGNYTDASGTQVPLAEGWNGTSWTIEPILAPSRTTGAVLSGVSCSSSSACVAVGQDNGMALAEEWNGTTWTAQTPPAPSGAPSASLSAVSCTSALACIAVGQSSGSSALVERWNGTTWTAQTPPLPSAATSGSLAAVACTAASVCVAVGQSDGSNALVEQWDGTTWTAQTPPTPSGYSVLSGVACTSASACTAVGNSGVTNADPQQAPLVEQWDGSGWTSQSTPVPTDTAGAWLSGVSCPESNTCTAVGYFTAYGLSDGAPLAESWNGTSWSLQSAQPPPSPSYNAGLAQVSCTSATACTAVGMYSWPASRTLAERYTG